jgi:nicotinate-nucleotide adenylyltransferase
VKFKKIGLFGGTFNPVHLGHLIIANIFLEEAGLDEVVFIPASVSPFKIENDEILDSEQRLKLIDLSINNNPNFSVSDYEITKGGISFTYETVKHFSEIYSDAALYWLIGGDQYKSFHKWKNYKKILENANLAVAFRQGSFLKADSDNINKHLSSPNNILFLNSPIIEISSSEIRERIKSGKSIKYLVSYEAEKYLLEKNLYR